MIRRAWLKGALYLVVAGVFAWSLFAIVLTGPIRVRPARRLELPYTPAISPDRLRRDVERLSTGFGPRSSRDVDNLASAADWIAAEMEEAGLEVELQHYEIGARRYRNVVGFRRGLVPGAAVRVIGAHYDALGPGPAADDNASGVAALLELVRSRPAVPPRRSQYFVAFGGGEHTDAAGTGSRHFARALRSDGIEVDLMLALDGVGHFTDAPGSQRFPFPGLGLLYPDRGNYLVIAGDLGSGRVLKRVRGAIESMTDLPVHTVRFPSAVWGGMGSDHRAFRELGMPGVLVTDLPELRVPWHGAEQDTADKLDYERMAEVVRGLHSVVLNRDVAD